MYVVAKVYDSNKKIAGLDVLHNGKKYFIKKEDFLKYQYENIRVSRDLKILGEVESYRVLEESPNKKLILYHGSFNRVVVPEYGKGQDKHDYGRGFYMTPHIELAKEWAWADPRNGKGYLHTFELDRSGLSLLNFNKLSSLSWLAELMSHRSADNSARYKRYSKLFIEKFRPETDGYDVVYGWRADSSYFAIAKRFVRDEFDYDLIEELFKLGDLNNQFCLKSRKAFSQLKVVGSAVPVDRSYADKYKLRDTNARDSMNDLIMSERNTMSRCFSYVMREGFKNV